MAKTKRHLSIPAGNTPPPPPPFTGVHGLIRYALIRHIDHRRDSISLESSHRTFITSKAENTHLAHTCKAAAAAAAAAAVAGDYCCESLRRLSVCTSTEQLNPGSRSPTAPAQAYFSKVNNRKAG